MAPYPVASVCVCVYVRVYISIYMYVFICVCTHIDKNQVNSYIYPDAYLHLAPILQTRYVCPTQPFYFLGAWPKT